jgi:peptide/nickel transport system ATP-binding protein
MTKPLLSIQNLEISFKKEGIYSAVIKNISYDLQHNEIRNVGNPVLGNQSLLSYYICCLPIFREFQQARLFLMVKKCWASKRKKLQQLRGNQIAMIFQEPMSSLNPSLKCGFQVQEILLQHTDYPQQRPELRLSLFEK